jgi:hypothetical protein
MHKKRQNVAYLHPHTRSKFLNACTSCRERRNSTLSHKCALRKRSSAAQEQEPGPEAAAAVLAAARALRAPTGFRGCVRGARGGCLLSVLRGGGRLPVAGLAMLCSGLWSGKD